MNWERKLLIEGSDSGSCAATNYAHLYQSCTILSNPIGLLELNGSLIHLLRGVQVNHLDHTSFQREPPHLVNKVYSVDDVMGARDARMWSQGKIAECNRFSIWERN